MFLFDNKSNVYSKVDGMVFESHYITDFFDYFDFRSDVEIEATKLNDEDFEGYISRLTTENVILELSQRNCLMKFRAMLTQHWLIAIPTQNSQVFYDHAYVAKENYIVLAPPNTEFSGVQSRFSNRFQLYVTEDYLNAVCHSLHLPEVRKLIKVNHSNIAVLNCAPAEIYHLQRCCLQLYQIGFDASLPAATDFGMRNLEQWIEESIIQGVLMTMANAQDIQPKKVLEKRISTLKAAEEMMMAGLKYDLTTSDICQALGISKRTLEYLFKDFYQMSPTAYLKRLRLNAFRRHLQQSPGDMVISELAKELGFLHRGQLAKEYWQLFGELPSSTRQKSYMTDETEL